MNRTSQWRTLISMTAVAVSICGCYSQIPITSFPPPPATHIVADVTDSGVVEMGKAIGPSAQSVEGIVQSASRDTVTLSMLRVDHRVGADVRWNRELVSFPSSALANSVESRFDRNRTVLAAAGIVMGAFLAARAFQSLGADSPVDQTPNPAAILLIPFRLLR
jgi:hypothetical protein